jgi:hypothetical protein
MVLPSQDRRFCSGPRRGSLNLNVSLWPILLKNSLCAPLL